MSREHALSMAGSTRCKSASAVATWGGGDADDNQPRLKPLRVFFAQFVRKPTLLIIHDCVQLFLEQNYHQLVHSPPPRTSSPSSQLRLLCVMQRLPALLT